MALQSELCLWALELCNELLGGACVSVQLEAHNCNPVGAFVFCGGRCRFHTYSRKGCTTAAVTVCSLATLNASSVLPLSVAEERDPFFDLTAGTHRHRRAVSLVLCIITCAHGFCLHTLFTVCFVAKFYMEHIVLCVCDVLVSFEARCVWVLCAVFSLFL